MAQNQARYARLATFTPQQGEKACAIHKQGLGARLTGAIGATGP